MMRAALGWYAPPLRLIAHRGGAREAPENTLEAFTHAAALGVDAIELDVRLSADGVPVTCHDPTVDRTTAGTGAITGLSAAALAALGVPAFATVLGAVTGVPLVVEVKDDDPGLHAAVGDLLRTHGRRDDVIVASFHDAPLRALRGRGFATSASERELEAFWRAAHQPGAPLPALDAVALQVPLRHNGFEPVTPALVAAVRAAGLALHVWTVDEPDDVRRLAAAGVDGVITDVPSAVAQVR